MPSASRELVVRIACVCVWGPPPALPRTCARNGHTLSLSPLSLSLSLSRMSRQAKSRSLKRERKIQPFGDIVISSRQVFFRHLCAALQHFDHLLACGRPVGGGDHQEFKTVRTGTHTLGCKRVSSRTLPGFLSVFPASFPTAPSSTSFLGKLRGNHQFPGL